MKAQLAGSQLSYAASVALGNFWKAIDVAVVQGP